MENVKLVEDITIYVQTKRTSNKTPQEIGALWNASIDAFKMEKDIYAIYHNYESNHLGMYDFSLGTKKQKENYEKLQIKKGNYQKYTIDNDIATLQQLWQEIWSKDEPRLYTTDFEHYHDGIIDVYIAIA